MVEFKARQTPLVEGCECRDPIGPYIQEIAIRAGLSLLGGHTEYYVLTVGSLKILF